MEAPNFLTIAEQVADYLRQELLRGRWTETIPGTNSLATELGVNAKTVEAGLRLLEKDGLLAGQGAGRRRRIELPEGHTPPALRVAILCYEKGDEANDLVIRFENKLKEAGHTVVYASKNLTDLDGNTRLFARVIRRTAADAWVVLSGSKESLQYFEARQIPVFALYGFQGGLKVAGIAPVLVHAVVAATRRLIALGHQRIVLLDKQITLSSPASYVASFCAEMASHGIEVGEYNVPGWEGGYDGLYKRLESLFANTPPTAIFLFSPAEYFAVIQFLAHKGLRVPADVSLICCDIAQYFNRYQPTISHVRWKGQLVVNRIARWAKNIRLGNQDFHQTRIAAEFVEAGTVGVAPQEINQGS